MIFDFEKKVVLITGAARGIGKSIARKFACVGAQVIIVDNDNIKGIKTQGELKSNGYNVEYVNCDLRAIDQIDELMAGLVKKYGKIDILINNARAGIRTAPFKETEDNFQITLDVSLRAPLYLSQSFINYGTTKGKSGCILNISSVAASNIGSESVAYHLAKAALENLTRYLAVHGGPHGFRVNAIRPGFIVQDEHLDRYKQDSNEKYRHLAEYCHPLKKYGTSEDVANASLFLCSDFAGFITGQVLTVDGGLLSQDPFSMAMRIREIL
jgi:NAD(P)-dependent dehydrogenase (short-subunit alcohol dehydrogenase family)